MNKWAMAIRPDIEDPKCVVHLHGFDSINLRCQFHQHFPSTFLPIFWHQKVSNSKHSFVIFGANILAQNVCIKC